jgi:hypothetical protein
MVFLTIKSEQESASNSRASGRDPQTGSNQEDAVNWSCARGVEIPSRLWGKPLKVQGLMTKVRAFPQAVRSPWK